MFPRVTNYGLCTLLLLCFFVAPPMISWIGDHLSPANEVVLDLRGLDIPAFYKTATRNEDGSIDLTINIPASANVFRSLKDKQEYHLRFNNTMPDQGDTEDLQPPRRNRGYPEESGNGGGTGVAGRGGGGGVGGVGGMDVQRTSYPLTLDSPFLLNNPDLCRAVHPLHTLVIVHTATTNFQRRRVIRETWAGKHLMTTRHQRVLFLLGLTANVSVQRLLENEHRVYGDLVQGAFRDSYHNLTHKGVMGFRWIQQYCAHAQLIVKVDDDVYLNPFLYYKEYFPKFTGANRTIACHVRPVNTSPIQRSKGKWMVKDFEFRGYKHYPVMYCNGYMVIITPDIIKPLFKAAYTTPFFWVDDVYLYGMLADKVGHVKYVSLQKRLSLKSKSYINCYKKPNCKLLAGIMGKHSEVDEVWRRSLQSIPPEIKPGVNPVYLVT